MIDPTPLRRGMVQNHLAALQTALLAGFVVLLIILFETIRGMGRGPFPSLAAGWATLCAASATGYLVGLVAAINGKRLAPIDPANPASRSFVLIGYILLATVAGVIAWTPQTALAAQKDRAEKHRLAAEELARKAEEQRAEQAKLSEEVARLKADLQNAQKAGRQPDPALAERIKDLEAEVAEREKRIKALEEASAAQEEQAEEKADEPEAEGEEPTSLPEPPPAEDPVPKVPAPTPDGGLPEPPPPRNDDLGTFMKAAMGVAALVFPELLPVFAAMGLDMALLGTEVRDLNPIARNGAEIYQAGKDVDVPAMVKKIAAERFGNPTAAISSLQKLLQDPSFRKKVGDQKAEELTTQLDQLRKLWGHLPKICHAIGADRAMDLARDLPPLLEDADALAEYAGAVPAGMGCTRQVWMAVLKEYVSQTRAGKGLRLQEDGTLAPFPLTDQEATRALDAISRAARGETAPDAEADDDKPA